MAFIPALGAIVTSFVGAAVSTTLGMGLAAIGATAVGIGAVVGGLMLANKMISSLYEMPKVDTDASRQRTVKGTIEPQKILYGQNLVSGPISFVGTYGDKNRVLAHAVVLAGHEVEEITDIYFDDEVITDAQINASGYVTSGKFGPVGNKAFNFNGTNFGTNICKINRYTGASGQTADADLVANFSSYTSNHIGTGLAYITTHWLLKDGSQKTWDQYAPRDIKAIVKGRKVYDPRTSTTAYSDNPALCVADYLTDTRFGMGVSSSKIDWDSVSDAADACDVVVNVPSGTEKRFTCNGVLFATDTHKANINKLLSAMNGMLCYTNGTYVIRAGAYEAPSVSLNEDNLIGAVSVKTSFERSDRFNTITGTFIDPAQNYKATEFPEVQLTAALLRDNSEVLTKDIQLPMTNSSYMAQRIGHKLIQQSDQQKVVTFPVNLAGMQIAIGDRVSVTLEEFNWSNKVFICLGWTFSDSGNGGVNLILREDDSGSYADPSVGEYSTISATGGIITGFKGFPDPQNLTATAGLKSIELNWDNPDNMSDIEQIEVFASPNSAWASAVKIGSVSGTQFKHDESNAADPVAVGDTRYYWVRARGYSVGDSADEVSDRNPDNDVSSITATVGVIPWADVAGDDKPEDNANNTYVDTSGDIQGVSAGAGTSVNNTLNKGKTIALLLNKKSDGTANVGEASLVGLNNEGLVELDTDGFIIWNGSKLTVERDQSGDGFTVLTNLAGKRGFICFDTDKFKPFTLVAAGGNVSSDCAFVYKSGSQWYYDNNNIPVSFTPDDALVALGWLETGISDQIVRGGLFGEPISLTTASFPTDDSTIEHDSSGKLIIKDGGVDTLQIADNAITADKITANAITTSKLSVGDFSVLNQNPSFEEGDVAWSGDPEFTIENSNARTGSYSMKFTSTLGTAYVYSETQIVASEGESFYIEGYVKHGGGTAYGGRILIRAYDSSGTAIGGASSPLVTTQTSYTKTSASYIAPANTVYVVATLYGLGDATTIYYYDDIRLFRTANSVLIADGAVIADKISAGTVTADKLVIDGITLDSDGSGNLIVKDGGVDTTQIANNAVETVKILDNAVNVPRFVNGLTGFNTNSATFYTIATMSNVPRTGQTAHLRAGAMFSPSTGTSVPPTQYIQFDMRLYAGTNLVVGVAGALVYGLNTPSIILEEEHTTTATTTYTLQVKVVGGTAAYLRILNSFIEFVEMKK